MCAMFSNEVMLLYLPGVVPVQGHEGEDGLQQVRGPDPVGPEFLRASAVILAERPGGEINVRQHCKQTRTVSTLTSIKCP